MTRLLSLFALVIVASALLTAVPTSAAAAATPARQSTAGTQVIPATASAVHGCPFEDFCIYSGANYTGTMKAFFRCQQFDFVPFVGTGSWVNNQTAGTKAAFYDENKTFKNFTDAAFAQNPSKNWTNVFYVVPC